MDAAKPIVPAKKECNKLKALQFATLNQIMHPQLEPQLSSVDTYHYANSC